MTLALPSAPRLAASVLAIVLGVASIAAPVLAPSPAVAQAARDAQAEAFVTAQSQRALDILNSRSMTQAQKVQSFRAFVDQTADVQRITDFVLGKYRRTITPAQYQQFSQVFRSYTSNVYESRLDEYKGERFRVTGSAVRRPGDVVVTSVINGGQLREPRTVRWRVIRDQRQQWRVVDVEVVGIWLAITQQQDFVSTIDNAGGNINVLINQLRSQVNQRPG
jgi:phospholipid transport system substrate-binding protein